MKFWFKQTLSKTFPTLETKYQEQIKKDSETIARPTKVLIILLVFMETLRVTISEVLLKGAIGWDVVEVYFGFAILLSISLIGGDWFSKKFSFKRKGWGIIRPLFLILYCGVISYTLVRQMKNYRHNMREERDEFDFIAFGLIVIPNLLVSDILFNNWLMKCVLPTWQLLTLAVLLIVYQPLNLAALLFMIFEYLLYIIMIFWVKDKLTWRIFLQRITAHQWNQIHSEILKNIPDNVAVYDFYGKLLFENDFFKKLQETFGPIDILKSIKSVKIRQFPKSFKPPPTTHESMKTSNGDSSLTRVIRMDEDIHREETFHSSLGQQVFGDLEQVFEMLKYSYQEKLILNKDSFTFDGKCFLDPPDEILSIEIRLSIFEDTETMSPKFLVILRDTTQRDVIATLESNNKFKDNILSSLSHELKTPLNGIKALLDSSLQDPQVMEKTKRTYLKPAARSATLLGHVINDVLDYSLYNKKNLKMKIEKTDIKSLFTNTFELVRDHYYQHNITAMIEIDEQVPQFFHTDSARLTQVFINILSNAFKFTYEGTVLLTISMEGKDIRITVKDTGVGMDAETKKKLGNILPESLAGTKINNTSTGAGLGLTISQITATILGPKDCPGIYFETKLNEGSVFTFLIEDKKDKDMMDLRSNAHKMTVLKELVETHKEHKRAKIGTRETETEADKLKCHEDSINRASFFDEQDGFPLSEMKISNPLKYISSKNPSLLKLKQSTNTPQLSPASVSIKIDTAPEITKNNEILVIDDEPINILAFEIMMKQFGKVIDKAYGGVEALEMLERRRQKEYKVIFMDLNMPGMDGFEVTKRIKERIRKKEMEDVRIVACTAYHEFEYKDKCLRAGMDDFMSKPITKEQLGQILKKYGCL